MITIFYRNHDPDQKTKEYIEKEFSKRCRSVPDNSYICCCIESSEKNKLRATVNINSIAGRFNVCSEADNHKNLIEGLFALLEDQLAVWRANRFDTEYESSYNNKWHEKIHHNKQCVNCFGESCPSHNKRLGRSMSA